MTDFVVVGAGSAGCVLANRLSADPANRVHLLEAGVEQSRREISIPAAWPKLFKSECDWAYYTEPNRGLDGRRIFVPRGRMLGGTSALNAMVYLRGHPADFDEWAAAGNPGWSYAEVLPYFRRSEANTRGACSWHGGDGPLAVSDPRDPNPLSLAFVDAATATGITRNADCNGATQDGVGLVQTTTRKGRRWSAADAFLTPARRRPNLEVTTGAHVTRIVIENGRATGVACRINGREEVLSAHREVIVAAGAIESPKLLLLSGVGPADELEKLGIRVRQNLPGVGRHLQEHPTCGLRVRCRSAVSLYGAESPGSILRYLLFRRGPLSSNGPEAAGFVRTRTELAAPDVEVVLLPILWLNEGFTPPPEHGYSVAVIVLKPYSRGRVTLRDADPSSPPVIDTDHFGDAEGRDMQTMVAGIRMARQICASEPLAGMSNGELFPGPGAESDAELRAAVRAEAQTAWHPVGTCRMGPDGMSVVDAELRVHGITGLRVIDASIMPGNVRGHTNAATIMIAERGADLVLGQDGTGNP